MRGEQLDKTREVLIDLAPDYVPAWDKVMRSRSAHIFNMMVMDRKHFDQYCAWLFPILFELQKRLDPANYDALRRDIWVSERAPIQRMAHHQSY